MLPNKSTKIPSIHQTFHHRYKLWSGHWLNFSPSLGLGLKFTFPPAPPLLPCATWPHMRWSLPSHTKPASLLCCQEGHKKSPRAVTWEASSDDDALIRLQEKRNRRALALQTCRCKGNDKVSETYSDLYTFNWINGVPKNRCSNIPSQRIESANSKLQAITYHQLACMASLQEKKKKMATWLPHTFKEMRGCTSLEPLLSKRDLRI